MFSAQKRYPKNLTELNPKLHRDPNITGEFLLIYICNFHVLSDLLLIT